MKARLIIALGVFGLSVLGWFAQAAQDSTPPRLKAEALPVLSDSNKIVDALFFSDRQEFMAMQEAYGQPLEGLKASSTQRAQGKNNYAPARMADFDSDTAWVEGDAEYGVGESISFTWRGRVHNHTCAALAMMNGYQKSRKLMDKNSRVKTMDLYVDGKLSARLDVQDRLGYQTFILSELGLKDGQTVRLVIRDVYRGKQWKDTCISELIAVCVP